MKRVESSRLRICPARRSDSQPFSQSAISLASICRFHICAHELSGSDVIYSTQERQPMSSGVNSTLDSLSCEKGKASRLPLKATFTLSLLKTSLEVPCLLVQICTVRSVVRRTSPRKRGKTGRGDAAASLVSSRSSRAARSTPYVQLARRRKSRFGKHLRKTARRSTVSCEVLQLSQRFSSDLGKAHIVQEHFIERSPRLDVEHFEARQRETKARDAFQGACEARNVVDHHVRET